MTLMVADGVRCGVADLMSLPYLTTAHLEVPTGRVRAQLAVFVGAILALSGVEPSPTAGVMNARCRRDDDRPRVAGTARKSDHPRGDRGRARHGALGVGDALARRDLAPDRLPIGIT